MSPDEDPSAARKRRIELRAARDSKRLREEEDDDSYSSEEPRSKPSIRGIKRQARYEPGVPMTREELASWRKEARRVRNRESAAASRRKTRDRIHELEEELETSRAECTSLQSKYAQALQRILELEESSTIQSFSPLKLRQDMASFRPVSPSASPLSEPATAPLSPVSLDSDSSSYEHIKISRPTAA